METQSDANTSSSKKKKVAATAAVVVLALALAMSGTFAWSSLQQNALNETQDTVEPVNAGGRLHDDFVYTSADESTAAAGEAKTSDNTFHDKDIYVENYLSDTKVYARVKLFEYMEIGENAGTAAATDVVKVGSDSAERDNTGTWDTHYYGVNDSFHDYFDWKQKGQATYMPTFNMDNTSEAADIRGTKVQNYADYIKFVEYDETANPPAEEYVATDPDPANAKLANTEINNQVTKDDPTGGNPENYNQSHHAKLTENCTNVMSIEEWQNAGSQPGPYWVYDTDGWAYWAQPIEPKSATGLLLNDIELTGKPSANWYYGIYAKAEIVDASEWRANDTDNGYQFDNEEATTVMSPEAFDMMNIVAGTDRAASYDVAVALTDNVPEIAQGVSVRARATITGPDGKALKNPNLKWTVKGGSGKVSVSDIGLVTVDETATAGEEITITATLVDNPDITNFVKFTVKEVPHGVSALSSMTKSTTTNNVVEIDGILWYKIDEDKTNNKALIWAAKSIEDNSGDMIQMMFDDESNVWKSSNIRTYLNGAFMSDLNLTELSGKVVETSITTRSSYNSTDSWDTTPDRIFLLSEADCFGTLPTGLDTKAQDYTVINYDEVGKPAVSSELLTGSTYWLRSPRSDAFANPVVDPQGNLFAYVGCNNPNVALRPAMWVDLS